MITQLPLWDCQGDTWAASLVLLSYQMPSYTSILVTSVIIIFIPTIWIRPRDSKKSSSINRKKLAKRLSLELKKREVDELCFEYFSPLSPGFKTFLELFWIPVHVLVFLLIDWYLQHTCDAIFNFVPWHVFCHSKGLPSACWMLIILSIWFMFHILDPSYSMMPPLAIPILISLFILL